MIVRRSFLNGTTEAIHRALWSIKKKKKYFLNSVGIGQIEANSKMG